MKTPVYVLPLFVLILCGALIETEAQNKPVPDSLQGLINVREYNEGWLPLFNGKDLQGWKGFLTPATPPGWYVENGLLVTRGDSLVHPVDLITIPQFEDFELSLEWSISWQGNSGIFYHSLENSWAAWATGPEYALVDEANLDEMEGVYKTGSCYGMYPPVVDCLAPQGAFNLSHIRLENGHAEHWLNGNKVVDYQLWSDDWYAKLALSKWKEYPQYGRTYFGSIGLQGHGMEAMFKNIKIRDLTNCGRSVFELTKKENWTGGGENQWLIHEDQLSLAGEHAYALAYMVDAKLNGDFVIRFQFFAEELDTIGFRLFDSESYDGMIEVASFKKVDDSVDEFKANFLIGRKASSFLPGKWNKVVLRRIENRVLLWLNSDLVAEKICMSFPEPINSLGFSCPGGPKSKLMIRNVFIHSIE